jgi:hypothetical protein
VIIITDCLQVITYDQFTHNKAIRLAGFEKKEMNGMRGKSIKHGQSGNIGGYGIAVLVLIMFLLCAVSPVSATNSDDNERVKNEELAESVSPENTSRFRLTGLARALSTRFLESPLIKMLDKVTGFGDASVAEEMFGFDQRKEGKYNIPEKNDAFEKGLPGMPGALDPPGISVQNNNGNYSSGSNQNGEAGPPDTENCQATGENSWTCNHRNEGTDDYTYTVNEDGSVTWGFSCGSTITVFEDGSSIHEDAQTGTCISIPPHLDDYHYGDTPPDRFGIVNNPQNETNKSVLDSFDIWKDRDNHDNNNDRFGIVDSPTVKKPVQGATCDDRLGENNKGYKDQSLNLELERVKLVDPPRALDSQSIKNKGQTQFQEVLLEADAR